ncbi:MAG: DNA photolyase [Desulfobacterales bacterium]|nr:DNA photolyase [Desulfobacterales bacterium]
MRPQTLYIDSTIADTPQVDAILNQLRLPYHIIDHSTQLYDIIHNTTDPISSGKTVLFLTQNKGQFIKKCPGTSYYTCCGYHILHIGTYCTMDCSYCILQSYFHPPVLQLFVNFSDAERELVDMFSKNQIVRIGTGEFTDSLIWDQWIELSSQWIQLFSNQTHAVLELKTKTAHVLPFRNIEHRQKTIFAWSLNTEWVIATQERGTASLEDRLEAARQCESWGYKLAFHFDPIIIYEDFEKDYTSVINRLFSVINPHNIVWISLGTFRFMPQLKSIIQYRFPDSTLPYGEFIPGVDGKMRYFKPLRIQAYRKLYQVIHDIAPGVLVYFCMEDDEVWQQSLGYTPLQHGGLKRMLDKSAMLHCSLESKLIS